MNIDKIERYLAKKMTPDESIEFELRMSENPQLRQEVKELEKAIEALRFHEKSVLKSRLKQWEQQKFENTSSGRPVKLYIYLLAGLLLVLLALIWNFVGNYYTNHSQNVIPNYYEDSVSKARPEEIHDTMQFRERAIPLDSNLQNKKNIQSTDELYAMYFVPYTDELLESEFRGQDDEKTAFEMFQFLYINKKYQEAINIFDSLDPSVKENDNVLFLKANALMAINKIDEATLLLETIIKNKESRNIKEALWFLGLCSIYKGDLQLAKHYLSNSLLKENKTAIEVLKKISH